MLEKDATQNGPRDARVGCRMVQSRHDVQLRQTPRIWSEVNLKIGLHSNGRYKSSDIHAKSGYSGSVMCAILCEILPPVADHFKRYGMTTGMTASCTKCTKMLEISIKWSENGVFDHLTVLGVWEVVDGEIDLGGTLETECRSVEQKVGSLEDIIKCWNSVIFWSVLCRFRRLMPLNHRF